MRVTRLHAALAALGVTVACRWRDATRGHGAGAAPARRTLAVDGPRRLEDLSTAAVAADAQLRAEFVTSECIMCNDVRQARMRRRCDLTGLPELGYIRPVARGLGRAARPRA